MVLQQMVLSTVFLSHPLCMHKVGYQSSQVLVSVQRKSGFLKKKQRQSITGEDVQCQSSKKFSVENEELLLGDVLTLFTFCCYKQIQSIVFSPTFPGWTAPMRFNPDRFIEFFAFSFTCIGTLVAVSYVTGGYTVKTSQRVKSLIENGFISWFLSMPVDASWLVLVASRENNHFVMEDGWADHLPLAATGIGEPWVTAAQILGLICLWRSFYGACIGMNSFRVAPSMRRESDRDVQHVVETAKIIAVLMVAELLFLRYLAHIQDVQ